MEEMQPERKRRRIHLDVVESVRLSQSEDGSASLRQPVDRTHPAACSEQAMQPRYRSRVRSKFKGPRRVSSEREEKAQETTQSDSARDEQNSGACAFKGNNVSEHPGMLDSRSGHEKTCARTQDGNISVLASSSSASPLNSAIPPCSSPNTKKYLQQNNNNNAFGWDSEAEELEMVKQSSDMSIQLLTSLGGFQSASSFCPDETKAKKVTESLSVASPQNSFKGTSKPRKRQRPIDPNQSSITSFFTGPSTSLSSSSNSNIFPVASISSTSTDRKGFKPQICEKITYGSPSKMHYPLKKISESVYVISDESSPERSVQKHSEKFSSSLPESTVVKKLFTSSSMQKTSFKKTEGASKSSKCAVRKKSGSKSSSKSKSNWKTSTESKCKSDSSLKQRTLISTFSTVDLTGVNFDDADEDDFNCIPASVPSVKQEVEVGKTFGLLNDSKVNTVEENWIQRMPVNILENIFCSLPMTDLCLSVSRVCVDWSNIVSSDRFMPWKKMYHKLKVGETETKEQVKQLLEQEGMVDQQSPRLLKLVSYMQRLATLTPDNNASQLLQSHPKYTWALALLQDKAPHCITNQEPNPWSLICALVLVSATVDDIHRVLRQLMCSRSRLLCVEVLERFYCIATFLLAFKSSKQTPMRRRCHTTNCVVRGLHYRVFYALYLYENSFVSSHAMLQQAMDSCSGQQSIVKYSRGETEVRLTHEQMRIVKYSPDLNSGHIIKIFAFAGTGKTTTLLRYTQLRPHLKFLLIVFNKSVCTHAQSKFPTNVTCKTGHGLAFAVTGKRYAARKKLNAGNLRVYDVAMALEKRETNKENLFIRAKFVIETLKNFMASDDELITSQHAPQRRIDDDGMFVPIEHDARMRYAEDASGFWERMKDVNDLDVRMIHDGYLKLYQLSKPVLHGYDIILVDEAQDLTPAVLDVVQRQSQPKLFVGDQHQQIYAFRGAVNAMHGVLAHKVFYLTQSFRFGPQIAEVANTLLEILKNETRKNIVGHGSPDSVSGDQVGQLAVLCRSNYTVFAEAVSFCVYSNKPGRVAFVGGLDGFGFSMLEDIYALMLSPEDRKKGNLTIQNRFIARFSNLGELEKYANKTLDAELSGKVRIVRTYQHNLPMCISKIKAKAVHNVAQADIVFSTVHKAKGLEFSSVKITEDFIDFPDLLRGPQMMLNGEEANLLYVAVTRAKHSLIMSTTVRFLLSLHGGGCYYPVLTEKLKREGVDMHCLAFKMDFKPQTLTLYRPQVTLGNKEVIGAGVLSPALLHQTQSDYACLLAPNPDAPNDQHHPMDIPDVDFQHMIFN